MRKFFIALGFACMGIMAYTVNKQPVAASFHVEQPSIAQDSTPQNYTFVINNQQYAFIDSVLRLSMRVTGYELPAKDADGLRGGIASIINFFTFEYQRQMKEDSLKKPTNVRPKDTLKSK